MQVLVLMVLVVVVVMNREDAAPVMKLNQSEISLNFKSLKNQTKTQEKIKKSARAKVIENKYWQVVLFQVTKPLRDFP